MPQDNSNYDDASSGPAAPDEKESADTGKTALLPKSVFGGDVQPGQKCEFEVVTVRGDEVEVRYSSSEKTGESEPQPQPEAPAPDGGGMASMLSD